MEEDWEQLAEKPKSLELPRPAADLNKWAGEDEDDVKESWEDEEDEKKDEEKLETSSNLPKVKPKSKLQEKIAEKERLEAERDEDEAYRNMTPEERIAEKLRLQKLQEAADLKLAMETLGIPSDPQSSEEGSIDSMVPTNKAEFSQLAQLISNRVGLFREKEDFANFVEELVKSISLHLSSIDIKRIKNSMDNLYIEKQKLEKEKTKKPKKTNKPKLRMEANAIDEGFTRYNVDYDVDDFM